jgi:hypothetical protein
MQGLVFSGMALGESQFWCGQPLLIFSEAVKVLK